MRLVTLIALIGWTQAAHAHTSQKVAETIAKKIAKVSGSKANPFLYSHNKFTLEVSTPTTERYFEGDHSFLPASTPGAGPGYTKLESKELVQRTTVKKSGNEFVRAIANGAIAEKVEYTLGKNNRKLVGRGFQPGDRMRIWTRFDASGHIVEKTAETNRDGRKIAVDLLR